MTTWFTSDLHPHSHRRDPSGSVACGRLGGMAPRSRNVPTWTCVMCSEPFRRYPSQIKNPESPTCSRVCYAVRQRTFQVGPANPNYRGGISSPQPCACGRLRDPRAQKCSTCSKRSHSVGGRYEDSPDELRDAIASSTSFLHASRKVKSSRSKMHDFAHEENLDLSHFVPGRGRRLSDDVLFSDGSVTRYGLLKKRILADGLLDNRCALCGLGPIWNEEVLTLELDHINGNPRDNRLSNLRFLCPNCHSQTPTNKGRGRKEVAGVA